MTAGSGLLGQPAAHGAWPMLYAATEPDVRGAEFFGPGWLGRLARATRPGSTAMRAAYDTDLAAALWQRSVELTGVPFA